MYTCGAHWLIAATAFSLSKYLYGGDLFLDWQVVDFSPEKKILFWRVVFSTERKKKGKIMKKTPLHWPGALWFPWFFFFWAVQLVGNLSLMDWSSLSERLSAQPIRLIWSCRIAFFGVKTPCQTLGLRSFVLQNEIDRAAATGGMPAGRLNCGDWRAIMNCRAEIAAPLLHYKCSLLTVICNQWAQAFCQSFQIRQAALLARSGRSQETCLLCSQMKLFDGSIVPIPLLRLQTLERKKNHWMGLGAIWICIRSDAHVQQPFGHGLV